MGGVEGRKETFAACTIIDSKCKLLAFADVAS
jgi:hypothetical protein